jgi:hypothetical protein
MSEEKYPDVIELKLKLCFSDAHKRFKTMIKKIEIPEEALKRLKAGKYVDGSLCVDKLNNRLTFRAFHRKPRVRKRDHVICYHENGWLKESEQNLKFFASVNKRVGAVCACQAMDDNLQYVTEVLFEKIENGEINKNNLTLY